MLKTSYKLNKIELKKLNYHILKDRRLN